MELQFKGFEHHELKAVAESENYTAADLLLKLARERRDHLRSEVEDRPRRCNEDLTQDWVYQAGQISALNAILGAPARADAIIKNTSRRQS